jgi:hypothetical protein
VATDEFLRQELPKLGGFVEEQIKKFDRDLLRYMRERPGVGRNLLKLIRHQVRDAVQALSRQYGPLAKAILKARQLPAQEQIPYLRGRFEDATLSALQKGVLFAESTRLIRTGDRTLSAADTAFLDSLQYSGSEDEA